MHESNVLESGPNQEGSRRQTLRALIVVTAFAVIGAFLLTIQSHPPLPEAVIDVKNQNENASGDLLTHTDNFWYVFEDQKGQPRSRLTVIPDNEVKTAWVSAPKRTNFGAFVCKFFEWVSKQSEYPSP